MKEEENQHLHPVLFIYFPFLSSSPLSPSLSLTLIVQGKINGVYKTNIFFFILL